MTCACSGIPRQKKLPVNLIQVERKEDMTLDIAKTHVSVLGPFLSP